MAKDNVIGLSIGLDTSSLKAGLDDAGRRLKETAAEFKANTAEMDDFRKSSEGLNAKLKQLNSNLQTQKAVLELMEKEYDDMGYAQDDMSKAAIELRTQILNQKTAISQTEKSISKFNSQLEEVVKAENETDKTVKDANKSLKEQEAASQKVSDGFTVMKGTIANLLSQGISKLASGFTQLFSSALSSAEATREYREDLGKLDASFKSANKSSEVASATYKKLYGVIGETDTTVEAAQQIAMLADSEEQVAKWADLASGVVGKFGDALKPETFYEAANETLKLGKATGAFTQMLEATGVDVEKFDEHLASLSTQEEKQAYMLEVSNKALAKAGEEYEKVNGVIIKANEETAAYANTQAELGAKMEPVNSAITTFKNEMLQAVLSEVDFEEVAKTVNEVLTKFKDEVLPKVIEGFKWVKDNLPEITKAAIALGAGFAALKVANIVMGIVKAVKAWTVATKGMTIAQKALNLAMKANLIGIIVAAIVGLVTWLVTLYQTNDEFKKKVLDAWDSIKKAFSATIEFIKNLFLKVLEFIKSYFMFYINLYKAIWNGLVTFFTGLWNGIKKIFSSVGQWFSNVFTSAKNGIVKAFNSVLGYFQNLWSNIKKVFSSVGSFFGGIWTTIKDKFTDIGQKVGQAISSTFKKAVNSLLSTAEKVLNTPIKAINTLRKVINKVPGINIGELKTFTLPRMAQGGVVDKATLGIFGEDGKEAVIPLEKNLGWIKHLSANIVKEMQVPNSNGVTPGLTTNNNTTNFTQIINAPSTPPLDDMYRNAKNLLKLKAVTN